MVGFKKARNQPKVSKGASNGCRECTMAQPLWGGGIWGRKIPAGLALLFADILSTDRSLGWNLARSRNRRRWEMVSDVPDGKKSPSELKTKQERRS